MSTRPGTTGHGPRRGLWFEEFEVGMAFESPARTITETDLVNFAGLSGDYTALHTDETFARRTAFRRRIAHGMLVQSIATGLGVRTGAFEGTIQALAEMTIQWLAPVFPGDTVRLVLEVSEVDAEPGKRSGGVTFEARVFNQDQKPVISGVWRTLILRERKARAGAASEESR